MTLSTPDDFQKGYLFDGKEVKYKEVTEICQGGPEVGSIYIKNKKIGNKDEKFGGPLLYAAGFIYVPIFTKKWYSSWFRLARIGVNDGKLDIIDKKEELIYLDRIENNVLTYHRDVEKVMRPVSIRVPDAFS